MTTKKYALTGCVDTVKMFIDQLASFRSRTDEPEELEWEIRVYEHILKEDSESRYKAYIDARFDESGIPLDKREIVKKLGWEVK